ncbi:phosphatase PAP2 family protein [Streptomyces lydicus]|uniref:phosphatase PAP2 family protein n=1 Tax=Streptomyces lydicus TaxID=47763 RepID=UPI000AC32E4D|nr:phosphatase PAP2 family protein [Streptomyces lydicus]
MLTWQVAGHGPLRTLDERLGRTVAGSGFPSSAAHFLADLGNTAVALPVLLLVMVWAGWRGGQGWRRGSREAVDDEVRGRWWLPPLAAGAALAAVPALVVPLKLWLARPGPPRMAGGAHDGFYPSGHAATAAVAYGVAALLVLRGPAGREEHRRGRGAAVAVLVAGVIVAELGVGVGLVRCGYHWPLDVLGSWCLAGVLLAAWCAVCGRWGPGTGGGRRADPGTGSGRTAERGAAVPGDDGRPARCRT